MAAHREREYLKRFFDSEYHHWRMEDVISVLDDAGRLDELFRTPQVYALHYARVAELMTALEKQYFGLDFGMCTYTTKCI